MFKLISFKSLAVLLVVIAAVAGIGNAAALTVDEAGQNVVQGVSNLYAAETTTVTYDINTDGTVTANVAFDTDAYDQVYFSTDGGTTYATCTDSTASLPSQAWECDIANGDLNGAQSIDIIATADDDI